MGNSWFFPRHGRGHRIPPSEINYRANIDEVRGFGDFKWAADGALIFNPAFDVTPAELVTGYITEKGVVAASDIRSLKKSVGQF